MSEKRYFEFKDGTSNKFWEIWREETKVMTRYGRIGSNGQTTVKDEGSDEKAAKLYERLIKEKTGKGYVEGGQTAPAASAQAASAPDWRALRDAPDKAKAVEAYFAGVLCEDDADREVLGTLMKNFRDLKYRGGTDDASVDIEFVNNRGDTESITLSKPWEGDEETPFKSLEALTKSVSISYECGGGGCIGSGCGMGVEDFLNDEDGVLGEVDTSEVLGVFDHGQNIIIGHPKRKNARKEPVLYFIDHESGQPELMKTAKSLTARQVLLRLLVQAIVTGDGEEGRYIDDVCE